MNCTTYKTESATTSFPPRPPRPPEPLWDNLPITLTILPRWVCWTYVLVKDWQTSTKPWSKRPLQVNGSPASSTDRATWAPFEFVQCAYLAPANRTILFDGIGFTLTESDDVVAFDFDSVIQDGRLIDERVLRWLKLLDSYTEISPSGRGLRVIASGSLPPKDRKIANYECYDNERFVTLTGNVFEIPA